MLKYNDTLPALGRGTSSRLVRVQKGYCVVSYNRNTRVRFHHSRVRFSGLGTVFVARVRNSRYFNLVNLLSALKVLKQASGLEICTPGSCTPLFGRRISFFVRAVRCRVRVVPISARGRRVVCRSRSLSIRAIPLGRHLPYYNCVFERGPALPRVGESVVSCCNVPVDRVGGVGGKTS